MKQETNKLQLANKHTFKEEIDQYGNIIRGRASKYNSLADMKRQIYSEISTYSDEELDFLRAYIKSRTIRLDKATSSFLPIWATIVISMINVLLNNLYSSIIMCIILVVILNVVYKYNDDSIRELNLCSMYLELIEKVEETKGHTFNDRLAEEYKRSLAISEAEETTEELANDDLIEET